MTTAIKRIRFFNEFSSFETMINENKPRLTEKKLYELKNKQLMQPRKDKICLLIVARPVQLLY